MYMYIYNCIHIYIYVYIHTHIHTYRTSIEQYRLQPTEICGDQRATAVLSQLVRAHGFEPVDCGSRDRAPLLEPRGPRRQKHPRIAQYDQTGK